LPLLLKKWHAACGVWQVELRRDVRVP